MDVVRTTIDIDDTVLAELRVRQRQERRTLGQLASELLAQALADTAAPATPERLVWSFHPMSPRVDLDDRDAVANALDAD